MRSSTLNGARLMLKLIIDSNIDNKDFLGAERAFHGTNFSFVSAEEHSLNFLIVCRKRHVNTDVDKCERKRNNFYCHSLISKNLSPYPTKYPDS